MDYPMNSKSEEKVHSFLECNLQVLKGESDLATQNVGDCSVDVVQDEENGTCSVEVKCGSEFSPNFHVTGETNHCQVGRLRYLVDLPHFCCSIVISFQRPEETQEFKRLLSIATEKLKTKSLFNERTEEASAAQYFQFYGYLSQQQNMMQDYTRTATYQKAMLQNHADFEDKVVIDVGAGSGILSFFAVQAGAKKVYAIEASSMAKHAEVLVKKNNLEGKIILVPGKVEEVHIPEKVDIIISEPMGYMLYNERMLESYLHAKKWLKPGGKMFPTRGDLHIAPFTDDAMYIEHFSKANFWHQKSFYGVDLSSLRKAALKEYFRQPVVDTFDVRILMAKPITHTVDFLTSDEDDLHKINIPVKFSLQSSGSLHGLAFWFDVVFDGSQQSVWLSTAPHEPLTHWYQVRCLLETPIFVKAGQVLTGTVVLISNTRQSYDVELDLGLEGTNIRSKNTVDLKNPYFRYTGTVPQPPAGYSNQSPTDLYWSLNGNSDGNPADGLSTDGGCAPGHGVMASDGMQSNSLYNNAGGMGGYNQYWSAGNTINLANLPTIQSYPTSIGSINYSNAGSSYIASSQPAMTYSQVSSRNVVMSGQHSRSYQSGYSKNGCTYR